MKPNPNPAADQSVYHLIEEAGSTSQAFGLGRAIGQVFAYLYFSREPRNLGHLQKDLGISKGSASTIVRQLEQWHAVRKVWIKGDRKDYYVAEENFGRILKHILSGTITVKMRAHTELLERMSKELQSKAEIPDNEQQQYYQFLNQRLEKMRAFHHRAHRVWDNPLLQKLLK